MSNILKVFEYNQHFVAMMNIINMARLNPPKEGHKHHIIPRCWFKMNNLPIDNSKDNLVLLSCEDHVKVHKLAYLCAVTSEFKTKMAYAYHRLTQGEIVSNGALSGVHNPNYGKRRSIEVREKISSTKKARMNDELRNKISDSMKGHNNPMYGKHLSDEHRRKISDSNKGRVCTEDTRRKISNAMHGKSSNWKGKHHSEESRLKMSQSQKGKVLSAETRRKMSEAHKGKVPWNKGLHQKEIKEVLYE